MRRLRSRPLLIVLALVVVAGTVGFLAYRQQVEDVYGYVFPDGIVADAIERSSGPAPVDEGGPPLPRVVAATTPTGTAPAISLRRIADLPAPSALVDPADAGPVLVTTLVGEVLALDLSDGGAETVLDLTGLVSTGGERGLLGLALAPDGDRLYVDLTDTDGDTLVASLSVRDGLPVGGADDLVEHLRIGQPYRNHNGGHLVFGPDGALWIGVGDGGSAGDPAGVAQDPDVLLGKMLRVLPDPDGGIVAPGSNPDWGERPEVWAIGLRNPWRYSFDRATGRLWIADVGQDAVEEVSVVDPSATDVNLGWDRREGTRRAEGDASPEYTDPVVEYGHDEGCSITGGHVYRGDAIPSLHGWYVFGDFCGGWIRAVPADDPTTAPVELARDLGSVISFAELEDGELVVLTVDGISAIEAPVSAG
ncbi:MAG: PQQ-dependent sugar dehydrogenase [Acidimicrobiia bacterium]